MHHICCIPIIQTPIQIIMKKSPSIFGVSRYMALAAVVAMSISACNLLPDDPTETPPAAPPPTPTIADGYGTLSAVKTITTQDIPGFGQIEVDFGVAAAAFFDGVDYNNFVVGGAVTCETLGLTQNPNNSYTFIPSTSEPTGIDFSGDPDWTVGGNGTIPAFSHTTNIGFPTAGAVTSATTVTKANGYTLSIASVSGADSVLYMVAGVIVTEPGNSTSHTFSAADLASIGTGPSVVQAAAYKMESAEYGGKTFYFVNEKVVTQSVTIE